MSQSHEEGLDSFTITVRREIVFYLRQLINDGERTTVMFDGESELLLTVLLEVNEDAGHFIFDWGGSESTNQLLLKCERAFFVATPQGVRNRFVVNGVRATTYQKRPAFAAAIPDKYVRLQRREFFRLTLPITQRRPCEFKIGDAPTAKQWQFSVVDIGLGGVGIESPEAVLPFDRGQIIPRAVVDLGKFGQLTFDMEVCFIGTVARGQNQTGRLGCRFVKVSPAQENHLQQFVTQVQRDERARLG